MRQLVDHRGRPVKTGKELGRGGEGAVFEIQGLQNYVAKIYLKAASVEKAQKLALMIRLGGESLNKIAAWPVASLHEHPGGPTIGLAMPKIAKPMEIHQLYSPAHRKIEFPKSDWRFLIRTALNCVAAFQALHAKNIVIGDVNQGNILVSKKATVKLIDCDSFQIGGDGKLFKCKVGVAHFTPPELPSYEMPRTANHDNFGLAVMIFHLLFMGRHPFSGRFSGKGEMPLEKAIKENRFAYGQHASRYQMAPPPSCLSLSELSPEIASLFEAAFAEPKRGIVRPTAKRWGQALLKLESSLQQCSRDPGHFHFRSTSCPWCRIVKSGGPNFFISVSMKTAAKKVANFNLNVIWSQISSVEGPGVSFRPAPRKSISSLIPVPIPASIDSSRNARSLLACIAGGGLLLTFIAFFVPIIALLSIPMTLIFSVWWIVLRMTRPITKERRRRKIIVKNRTFDVQKAKDDLSFAARHHLERFNQKRSQLADAKSKYERLGSARAADYQRLQSEAKERQLDDYLENCFISRSKIRGVGPSRQVTLESYGIETAADVTYERVEAVPGFGPMLTEELMMWRRVLEARFKFDPSRGAPASAVQALDMQYLQQRSQLQSVLESGPSELRRIVDVGNAAVGRLDERLASLENSLRQAELDEAVASSKQTPNKSK